MLAASAAARAAVECRCHGAYTHAYRGSCLPSFMVIGSQKAATSKLRWYLSRHPSIDIPKEEAFHGGPHAVAAWDTKENPTLLSSYLEAFEDVCNSTERITGLKMPDYIVMSAKTIELFHIVNPQLRIIVTLREPIARMYSYFSMQLRFGWSPINHMGKNPCMQRSLRALLKAKEAQVAAGVPPAGAQGPNRTAVFTSEEIMMTNLLCVRPCYAGNASGLGAAAQTMTWHVRRWQAMASSAELFPASETRVHLLTVICYYHNTVLWMKYNMVWCLLGDDESMLSSAGLVV